jgi:nucleoside-diphosphate-sugar epimerase
MKRLSVLLTGPGGRIGPHLIPSFRERYDLRLLDQKTIPREPKTILADLSDVTVLKEAMEGVDVVVHLAAVSDEAPFLEKLVPGNILGVHNTFEAARQAGVRRIVYASTVQTIENYPHDYTVQANDYPRPWTTYAATKLFGEALGRWYHEKHGIEFVALRIGAFQNYDSPHLRHSAGLRKMWLSPRDCRGILHAAIEREGIGYVLAFATSITEQERVSRQPARDLLGYESQDDIRALLPELYATNTAEADGEGR